jgi:galactokinase
MNKASLRQWREALEHGALDIYLANVYGAEAIDVWKQHYAQALDLFSQCYGQEGLVVIARCPGQINLMGQHIDYGGMPSVRMSVRGADTLTLARANNEGKVRVGSYLEYAGEPTDRFAPFELDLSEIVPEENVGTREALMHYAGQVCQRRLERTGSAQDHDWSVLVEGHLVYLESYFRARLALKGFDALVWSNVSPSGGMSSSSALVVSTACAALGVNDLAPYVDLPEADWVDGVGTSEWIRGTRGGTADHGGMIMGRSGKLVGVGVFPAAPVGEAILPAEYVALVLDTGVPRVYDEAVKEETVVAYPLGVFVVRELLLPRLANAAAFHGLVPDYKERIHMIRDISEGNLGIGVEAIYRLLQEMPAQTSMAEVAAWAETAGVADAYAAMHAREIEGKFQAMSSATPVYLRRRFTFGLAEQDRVRYVLDYLAKGDMATALELARISHVGDFDVEVEVEELKHLIGQAQEGAERARLCFLAGGYGRMTPEYDLAVRGVNEYLIETGGLGSGALQRLGAGWGGNMGGLIRRDYIYGNKREEFTRFLENELAIEVDLAACVAAPGQGAGFVEYPEEG